MMMSMMTSSSSSVSFYLRAPRGEVSLEEFETAALDRLRVLRAVEGFRARGKKGEDLERSVQGVMEKYLPRKGGRKKDEVSHHALRLAFCANEERRRWLLEMETALFRHRFAREATAEQLRLMDEAGLPYKPMPASDFAELRPLLAQVMQSCFEKDAAAKILSGGRDGKGVNTGFFKVPFEDVPELVARRRVLVRAGFAYVPSSELTALVCGQFRMRLSKELIVAARHWASVVVPRESERLQPIVEAIATQPLVDDWNATSAKGTKAVGIADLDVLGASYFPLCMRTMYRALKDDHHLKHGGRLALGLFLKGIGLSLDDALAFWRREFSKKPGAADFDKNYAYNIKHNYGREGNRKDYTPYSCVKVISATPYAGEYHGCPFKTFGADELGAALKEMKVSDADKVVEKAKSGHYQIACGMTFEGKFGCACDEGIQHPNQYFAAARKLVEGEGNDDDEDGRNGDAAPTDGSGAAKDETAV